MSKTTDQSSGEYIAGFKPWERSCVAAVHQAVYGAALALTDAQIEEIVKDALLRARRDLSS